MLQKRLIQGVDVGKGGIGAEADTHTFCGYYLAGCCQGQAPAQCLRAASAAAAIAITRPGAAPAIPARDEVESLLK